MGTVNGLESGDFGPVGNTRRLILPAGRKTREGGSKEKSCQGGPSWNGADWDGGGHGRCWVSHLWPQQGTNKTNGTNHQLESEKTEKVREKNKKGFGITSCSASQICTLEFRDGVGVCESVCGGGVMCSSMRWGAGDDVIYRWTKRQRLSSRRTSKLRKLQRREIKIINSKKLTGAKVLYSTTVSQKDWQNNALLLSPT